VSVDTTIYALTIMPAKEIEHFFFAFCTAGGERNRLLPCITDQVIRGCALLGRIM
jgi:hypothetical protein